MPSCVMKTAIFQFGKHLTGGHIYIYLCVCVCVCVCVCMCVV